MTDQPPRPPMPPDVDGSRSDAVAPPEPDPQPGEASWPGLAAAYAVWPETGDDVHARFIPPPEKRLDPKAKTLWIINNLIGLVILVIVASAIMVVLHRWRDIGLGWTVGIPVAIAVVGGLLAWLDAVVRYRVWRYEIRADEVDLQHGLITQRRQLVPMARIQHVDSRQGPLERRYGLATVLFYTAAGGMEIPALNVDHAAEVRNQIAALAKVHDDL